MNYLMYMTDEKTKASHYCLAKIHNFLKYPYKFYEKQIIELDPGVREFKLHKNQSEYGMVKELHSITQNQNIFISIDYPCDMNPIFSELFIQKTNWNNRYYSNLKYYLTTIQSYFQNIQSFIENWNINRPFINQNKVLGLGNLCRIMYPNEFTDQLFEFLYNQVFECKRIHIFGLANRLIVKYIPKLLEKWNVSIDSTKFTRAPTNEIKQKYGLNCNSKNRDEFFMAQIHKLQAIWSNVVW